MDLLFSRYASPMDLINTYIDNGRFGEFVTNFLELENDRRKEKLKHDDDWMMWTMYTRLYPVFTEKTFPEWKASINASSDNNDSGNRVRSDADMTEEDIHNIMDSLFSK